MSRSSVPPVVRRRVDAQPESGAAWESPDIDGTDGIDGIDQAIDPDEFREFLAGDILECEADPNFKERLRNRLWRIVRKTKSGA